MKTRRLKPEDKHVTRKELLAELLIIAKAADESIAQLRAEMHDRLPPKSTVGAELLAAHHDVNPDQE
jgi:hypothetical protein